jgi:hypothetical protein
MFRRKKVKLGKLLKKLRREIATNPKKAIFLGIPICVALYFWGPLVAGWMSKEKAETTEKSTTASASEAVAEQPVATTLASANTALGIVPNRPSWQQVVDWMRNDPRTMIAPPLTNHRDPFESLKSEVMLVKPEIGREPKHPALTPAATGLMLTSTILGPQRRVAQINGKSYTVGQTVEVPRDKNPIQTTFKLMEVHPRRVVLQSDEGLLELTIPEPGSSGKIEMIGAGGAGS